MGEEKGSVGPPLPQVFLTWDFRFWDVRPESDRFGLSNLTKTTPKMFGGTHGAHKAPVALSAGGFGGTDEAKFRERRFIGHLTDALRGQSVNLDLTAPEEVRTDVPAGPGLTFRDAKWNHAFEIQMRNLLFQMELDADGYFGPPEDPGIQACFVAGDEPDAGLAPHGYVRIEETTKKDGTRVQDVLVDWKFDALKRFTVRKFYPRTESAWQKNPETGVNERVEFTFDRFYLVLHVTTGEIIGSQFNTFVNAKSIHYLVDIDGHVVKMLPEEDGAHHAGWQNGAGFRAGWRDFDFGRFTNANKSSIDIEHVQVEGVEFWPGQTEGSVRIVREVTQAFGIPPCDVVRHRDLAVHKTTWANGHVTASKKGKGRSKNCPGLAVPWERWQDERLTLWPADISPSREDLYRGIFSLCDFIDDPLADAEQQALQAEAIELLQHDLRQIGYWCPLWKSKRKRFGRTTGVLDFGSYDEATEYAVLLCQERFMEMRSTSVGPSAWGRTDFATAAAIRAAAAHGADILPPRSLPDP